MESQQESTFVHLLHILRAGVLLAALIAVPGTAVCWNLIPKDVFLETKSMRPLADLSEETQRGQAADPFLETKAVPETEASETVFVGPELAPSVGKPLELPFSSANAGSIRMMGGLERDETRESVIPSDAPVRPAAWAFDDARPSLERSSETPSRNFSALEQELKQLGAKYYRLEKWGSRGELFRFSCYVSPSGPYRNQYQKHFQAIDTDELRVMERIVDDIRRWKGDTAAYGADLR